MAEGSVALQGEMGSVAAAGRNLSSLDSLNQAMGHLRAGIGQVQASGKSKALTQLVAACRPIESLAQQIAAARVGAGSALVSYAGEVSAIQEEVRRLQARKVAAESRRHTMMSSLAIVDQGDPDGVAQARRLSGRIGDENIELQQIKHALAECDQARRAADTRCANSLNSFTASLAAVSAGAGGRGQGVSLASLLTVAKRTTRQETIDSVIAEIATGSLTPDEAAKKWASLQLSEQEVKDLPIRTKFRLAGVDGLPGWAQNIVSQDALNYAIKHPGKAYKWMGFGESDLSKDDFAKQLTELKAALNQAKTDSEFLPGSPKVQMLGFGNHDGAITTAISFGDIDTASNIGVNVPGIGSTVDGIGNALGGAKELFRAADDANSGATYAMVTWYGYRTPGKPPVDNGVWSMDRADAGATELADFLDGVHAFRALDQSTAPERVVVFAHSYGSTTATEALKLTVHQIDAFVTYGSAGIKSGTQLNELHADEMYSTIAAGDNIAPEGYWFNDRMNPIDIAHDFSAEIGEHRVTAHDMFTEDASASFWNWGGKVGYLTAGTSSLQYMGRVFAGKVG